MKIWDDIHYSFRGIDGYNKAFNFIMSAREPGKTTGMWVKKIYQKWIKCFRPWYYCVRNINEINESLIHSIEDTINDFQEVPIKLSYHMGDFDKGIADIYIEDKIFIRIIALSIKLRRIKLNPLRNAEAAFMDEYIIDPRSKEKYLTGEYFKIKEAYNTWRRNYGGDSIFKFYFCANPYSLFNPLFMGFQVKTNKLKRDSYYVGDIFVIHWAVLSDALKEKLLKENPLYKFDDDYTKYALDGEAINDTNIKISKQPAGFKLQFVFKYDKILIGIYFNYNYTPNRDKFYISEVKKDSITKFIFCLNFHDLAERSILIGNNEKIKLSILKNAMRCNAVLFENINVYYIMQEVYLAI